MDAEVWSYADTRNGRRLLLALFALIITKELAVMAMPYLGLPVVDPIWAPITHGGELGTLRGPLVLAIKLVLVFFIFFGLSLARWALAGIYLGASAYAITQLQIGFSTWPPIDDLFALANAFLGFLIGLIVLLSQQLRAYLSRKAAARLIIPIPGEDELLGRHTKAGQLGNVIVIALRRAISILVIVLILGAIAALYGLPRVLEFLPAH